MNEEEAFQWFIKGYQYAIRELSSEKSKDIRPEFFNDYWVKKGEHYCVDCGIRQDAIVRDPKEEYKKCWHCDSRNIKKKE